MSRICFFSAVQACCEVFPAADTVPFLRQGGKLRRATYSSSVWSSSVDFGASYSCRADEPAVIVARAKEAAKFGQGASGWSGYSLLTNNCETFACWCSTGRCVYLCVSLVCACFGFVSCVCFVFVQKLCGCVRTVTRGGD